METQLISHKIKMFTSENHADTEKRMVRQLRNISVAEDYADLLQCFYGFFEPLEALCGRHLSGLLPDFNERRRAELLKNDLRALNRAPQNSFFTQIPDTLSKAGAFGFFYVMEGSTMGGPVIMKMVRKKCPEIPLSAFTFFSGHGNHNHTMWGKFLKELNTRITDSESEEVCEAAAQCFVLLGDWIDTFYHANASTAK